MRWFRVLILQFRRWWRDLFLRPVYQTAAAVKRDMLEEARRVAAQTGEKDISKVLMSLYFGERELLQAKARQMGVAFADLDRLALDHSAIMSVPEDVARRCCALPLRRDADTLWVAVATVESQEVFDNLRRVSGCRVIPVLTDPESLESALDRAYSS